MNDNDSQFTEPVKRAGARGNPAYGAKKGERRALKHGLVMMKRAMSAVGNRALDGRYRVSKALGRWREDLIDDLGGSESISTQQAALVDLCVKSKLLLDSVDVYLLSQRTLINTRRKTLFPVVLQRQQLADGLAKYLNQLGLERRHKVKTLHEILANEAKANGADDGQAQS
jgi:hypothetical protein